MAWVTTEHSSKKLEHWKEIAPCNRYNPCPVCYKCMDRASHLYQICDECEIPFCVHDDKKRNYIIRRENFAINVSEETGKAFKKLGRKDV